MRQFEGFSCDLQAYSDAMASEIMAILMGSSRQIAFAESCTGGGCVQRMARMAGVSAVLRGGMVAYATDLKVSQLGVDNDFIERCGVVSRETAIAMAAGVAYRLGADIGVSTTGYAGPSGGTEAYPVGSVCFGIFERGKGTGYAECVRFRGSRERVMEQASVYALEMAEKYLKAKSAIK